VLGHHLGLLSLLSLFLLLLVVTSPFLTLVADKGSEKTSYDGSGLASSELVAAECTGCTSS
jgi:hypothetical protein